MSDLRRLATALEPVQAQAADLPWAAERPWRVETHVFHEGGLVVVDLHDLNSRTARDAVRRIVADAEHLDAGAVKLVTGRGRHSVGPGGVLTKVVRGELKKAVRDRPWRFRSAGAAWILVVDEARAPAAATGRLGWGFWLFASAFALATAVALAHQVGWL